MLTAVAAVAEPRVQHDVTPWISPAEGHLLAEWLAPSTVTVAPVTCETACERGRWAPGAIGTFLSVGGGHLSSDYGTTVFLRQEPELPESCWYMSTREACETTLTAWDWPGSSASWAFVNSGISKNLANDPLFDYVVASLETAPSNVLLDVVDLLTEPPKQLPRFSASASAASPLKAVKELKDFLGLTWRQVEAATGIDENTFYYWQRAHATPRPSTVRKLMGVYGLLYALVRSSGEEEALAWLDEGSPHRRDLLLAGEVKRLRAELDRLIGAPTRPPIYHAYGTEEELDEPSVSPRAAPRLASRTPIRRRRALDE